MKSKLFAVVAGAAMVVSSSAFAESTDLSLAFAGVNRTYILHIPEHYDPSKSYPLMLVFHGKGGKAARMEQTTGFDAVADRNNFFVAYPDTIGAKWKLAGENNDIIFNEYLIQQIESNYPIDPTRIYISGFSQGGGMAQKLACVDTDKIAGVAVVSENLNPRSDSACHPSQPITFVLFHGTADPISPYNGGPNGLSGAQTFSAQQTAQFWAQSDGCPGNPVVTSLPDKLSDGTTNTDTEQSWSDCNQNTTVTFYTIQGGGHAWPGGMARKTRFGPISQNINASQIIWQTLHQSKR